MRSADLLKENFITSYHIVPSLLNTGTDTFDMPSNKLLGLVFHTKCSVYVEKLAVNPLQVIKPAKRKAWNYLYLRKTDDFLPAYKIYTVFN